MTIMAISSILMSLTLTLPMMLQPLSLGLNLILLISMTSILMAFYISTWYSYILFLVYVGGLLVMFAYVSSLIPNNFFSSMKTLMLFLFMATVIFISLMTTNSLDSSTTQTSMLSIPQKWAMSLTPSHLISSSSFFILLFLGLILFANLLAVVKVCYHQSGPLRPFSSN
uniref:NADH dehydrogenase subunit 6 n=1 Tax=Nacella concinna TaxID=87956 RepID=A0A3S5FW49_9GAST|nr:NADH dehydrogenase subunit 6 [Nacella concinna]